LSIFFSMDKLIQIIRLNEVSNLEDYEYDSEEEEIDDGSEGILNYENIKLQFSKYLLIFIYLVSEYDEYDFVDRGDEDK